MLPKKIRQKFRSARRAGDFQPQRAEVRLHRQVKPQESAALPFGIDHPHDLVHHFGRARESEANAIRDLIPRLGARD
jgi:hypothetical protein